MNNFKRLVAEANGIIAGYKGALEANKAEGRSNEWTLSQNKATMAKYKAKLAENATARTIEVTQGYMDATKKLNTARKKGAGADKVYALGLAQSYLTGDLETAFKSFSNLMVDPDNRGYKYIFEDFLRNRVMNEEPAAEYQLEELLNQYRSDDELEAIKEQERLGVYRDHAKMIDGMAVQMFEELSNGEKYSGWDLAEVWNHCTSQVESNGNHESAKKLTLN